MRFFLLLFAACTTGPVTEQLPTTASQNDPVPKQPQASGGFAGQSFTGSIAGLRQSGAGNDTPVTINKSVVVSISGNGKTVYVSDPGGGAYSGMDLELCNSKSGTCVTGPNALGVEYKVQGTLLVSSDGTHSSIASPTFTVVDPGPVAVAAYQVPASEVGEIAANNADVLGTYVAVAFTGAAQVSNASPAGFLNSNYTSDMEAACRGDNVTQDTSQCCPKGVGPKYFGFEVQANGTTIGISTANYPSSSNGNAGASLEVWPCDGDFSKVVTSSTMFATLGGVYDVNFGLGEISPATDNDWSTQ